MKYIVDFDNTASQDEIDAWLNANSITQFTTTVSIGKIYVVEHDGILAAGGIVSTVTEDVNISSQLLQLEEIIPLTSGPTATFDNNADWWKTAVILEPEFNSATTTFEKRGSRGTVYVVDSGIYAGHPDLANTAIENLFTFTSDYVDSTGHGTAIASIVAGAERGITVGKVKVVKIFDGATATMLSDIVNAIDAIHSDILANTDRASIVNLSWAIPKNDYVEQKLQTLIDAGALLVAAAGNNGVPIENVTPASMASAITVGSFTHDFVPADFSNYTSAVSNTDGQTNYGALDGWAPGVDIGVATLDGSFGNAAGTSMSAAILSASLVYNSDMIMSLNGAVIDYAGILQYNSIKRTGLLNLTDKYASSVNAIATITTKATSLDESGTYSATRVIFSGEDNAVLVVDNRFVTKYNLDSALPDGLSLSNGWIVGTPTVIPTERQDLTYTVSVDFESGAHTSFVLTLHIMPLAQTPEDKQVMVQALGTCGGTNTPQANCSGQCAYMTNCYWGGKASGCLCPV